MKFLLVVLSLVMVAGCSVGPDYVRPQTSPPDSLTQQADSSAFLDSSSVAAADTTWWEMFGDTVLTSLIRIAVRENNDVRIAAARVEEYMGYYGVSKSDFFPKINAEAAGRRGQIGVPGDGGSRPTVNYFNVNVSATWEIDIWGKIRRATEAARADLLATEEIRRGVVVSVIGLVAESYLDLLALDKQLAIAVKTAESRRASLDLFRLRYDKGDISELELNQIESQYWLAESRIPVIRRNIAQLEHALSVLLGRMPGRIPRGAPLDSLVVPGIPEGIPSEILEGRPDVRAAEEQLRAANARIGVAKAQYFPSISLTGLFGVASGNLSSLFESNSQIWNVGGGVLQPIFRWGEISGQVAAAEAFQKQSLYGYVTAVQSAFRDAEDALVARTTTQQQRDAQANQVDALRGYDRLARLRYREGVTSYLEVLDAERSLFDTELGYAETQAGVYKSVVAVYRAFAGSWVDWVSMKAALPDDPVERREPEQETE